MFIELTSNKIPVTFNVNHIAYVTPYSDNLAFVFVAVSAGDSVKKISVAESYQTIKNKIAAATRTDII